MRTRTHEAISPPRCKRSKRAGSRPAAASAPPIHCRPPTMASGSSRPTKSCSRRPPAAGRTGWRRASWRPRAHATTFRSRRSRPTPARPSPHVPLRRAVASRAPVWPSRARASPRGRPALRPRRGTGRAAPPPASRLREEEEDERRAEQDRRRSRRCTPSRRRRGTTTSPPAMICVGVLRVLLGDAARRSANDFCSWLCDAVGDLRRRSATPAIAAADRRGVARGEQRAEDRLHDRAAEVALEVGGARRHAGARDRHRAGERVRGRACRRSPTPIADRARSRGRPSSRRCPPSRAAAS